MSLPPDHSLGSSFLLWGGWGVPPAIFPWILRWGPCPPALLFALFSPLVFVCCCRSCLRRPVDVAKAA